MRKSVKVILAIFGFIIVIGVIGALAEDNESESERTATTVIEPTTPPSRFPSCDELAPDIIELSREKSAKGSAHILKLYEISEVSRTTARLECSAVALTSRNTRQNMTFYAIVDEDGDGFIGFEGGATIEPTPEPTPELPEGTYGPGMYKVGSEIQPGTYKGVVPENAINCYWARLKSPSGSDNIIANDLVSEGQFYANIEATDAYFELKTCTISRVE